MLVVIKLERWLPLFHHCELLVISWTTSGILSLWISIMRRAGAMP